ncbi:Rho-related GTP-binding protein RhoQ [Tritrichomonas foetus]|uniref:Rho-related GTP-binding protein RhoQ n=1 Tax=Tritrichomonas foetus TaxID=1144522 RepID=A0A1J4KVC5_9EUKA|nr:Rho-related GTP-binding protein RhoQ [Tritrichomonas foetus]|eukprot:OHT15098.1 Rho-related GTP-binding protein RhoQ [Tritrichomonas foetus]
MSSSYKTIVFIGDCIGKTCFISQLKNQVYPTDFCPTVFDCCSIEREIGGKMRKLSLYDSSGLSDLLEIRKKLYGPSRLFVICFSVVSKRSFDQVVLNWIPEVKAYSPNSPYFLLGLQTDLRNDNRTNINNLDRTVYTKDEGKIYAVTINALGYSECSNRSVEEVKAAFDDICKAFFPERKFSLFHHGSK